MAPMDSNVAKPGETISEMSANSLITKEEKAKQYNMEKVPLARPGRPLSKGPIASYKRKDSGGIAEDLVSLWGKVKNDPLVYQK